MIMRILTLLDMAEKVVIIELITFALTLLNELGMVEIYSLFFVSGYQAEMVTTYQTTLDKKNC